MYVSLPHVCGCLSVCVCEFDCFRFVYVSDQNRAAEGREMV